MIAAIDFVAALISPRKIRAWIVSKVAEGDKRNLMTRKENAHE